MGAGRTKNNTFTKAVTLNSDAEKVEKKKASRV